MPHTITAVGTLAYASGTAGTTLAVSPGNLGGALVLGVAVAGAAVTVTDVSGGGVGAWTRAAGPFVGPAFGRTLEVWFGEVTATGAATLTITFSTSVAGMRVDRGCQEFNSDGGVNAVWAADAGAGTSGTSAAVAYPTLTPSGTNRLYFGYGPIANSPDTVTSGYTLQSDTNGNPWIYNPSVSTVQSPTVGQGTSGTFDTVGALLVADTPVVDSLRLPVQVIQVP